MKVEIKLFNELSTAELFDILKLRQDIFILEQKCLYPDIDIYDKKAWHLFTYSEKALQLYARILPPECKFKNISIGRILCAKEWRGKGLAVMFIQRCIDFCSKEFPDEPIVISAQFALKNYYQSHFGFKVISDAYDDDGIQHIDMQL